ncbi:MAG: DUF465 domain-containing protein [Rhodobiaceae bacterium]|jgi:hypothetical protein|nr:DUF465 domain-containing protein [Rhodobiaceae bacterium]
MSKDARLDSLQRQHKQLEEDIERSRNDLSSDSLDTWTLKRKKLSIKQQMSDLQQQASL